MLNCALLWLASGSIGSRRTRQRLHGNAPETKFRSSPDYTSKVPVILSAAKNLVTCDALRSFAALRMTCILREALGAESPRVLKGSASSFGGADCVFHSSTILYRFSGLR